jgi:hypothetical protein
MKREAMEMMEDDVENAIA